MKLLILILIVVLIVQTCLFIYASFIDTANKRVIADNNEIIKEAQKRYNQDTENLKRSLEWKDRILQEWINKANKLDSELTEARKVNGLLKNRTAYVEELEDSFNQQAELEWNEHGYIEKGLKKERMRFVEGMKAGAEWLANCVGVKVVFEIDDRHKEATD